MNSWKILSNKNVEKINIRWYLLELVLLFFLGCEKEMRQKNFAVCNGLVQSMKIPVSFLSSLLKMHETLV